MKTCSTSQSNQFASSIQDYEALNYETIESDKCDDIYVSGYERFGSTVAMQISQTENIINKRNNTPVHLLEFNLIKEQSFNTRYFQSENQNIPPQWIAWNAKFLHRWMRNSDIYGLQPK